MAGEREDFDCRRYQADGGFKYTLEKRGGEPGDYAITAIYDTSDHIAESGGVIKPEEAGTIVSCNYGTVYLKEGGETVSLGALFQNHFGKNRG